MAERLGVATLSSGDLLREAVRRKSPIGQEVESFMKKGMLVPDRLVTDLMMEHLRGWDAGRSFVLDGFPRTAAQARALEQGFRETGGIRIDLAIDFEMSPEKVVRRLAGRRVCGRCRANYHVRTLPPKQPGVCDRCGGTLQARVDDEPQTIRKRLAVYEEESEPLLGFYRRQGKLRILPGDLEIEAQYEALMDLLKKERLVCA